MENKYFWLPYVPIVGLWFPLFTRMESETCIEDEGFHFVFTAIIQALSIAGIFLLIILKS